MKLGAEKVVKILCIFIEEVEQLIHRRDIASRISVILAKKLIKLIFEILFILLHAFLCVLIDNDGLVELALVAYVVLGPVDLLVLVADDLLDEVEDTCLGLGSLQDLEGEG
jgi:hypothetical protein